MAQAKTKLVLWDYTDGTFEEFENEEDLEEFITNNYDEDTVEGLQVFEVTREYVVNLSTETEIELEEV